MFGKREEVALLFHEIPMTMLIGNTEYVKNTDS